MTSAPLAQARQLVTPIPGPRSQELAAKRSAAVSHAVASTLPVYVERAGGGILQDVDGNSMIDLGSGIAVTNIGNAAPAVVEAVRAQVADFTHTCFLLAPYEEYVDVCAELNRLAPGTHEKRSALFNTGAEAVENAVKYARAFTGRSAIIVLDHAFHGRTNLTMAMTAKAVPLKNGFGPFASDIYRVPGSYPLRDGLSGPEAAARAIDLIERQVGASEVAAIVAEPIQGEGGFIVPAPGFLSALSEWCHSNGALLVADEIQSGFARTGDMFAVEHEQVVPDLMTTAKGIAGGLPLAAVTGRADVMDVQRQGGIGGTYMGNPVACAAALATMRTIESEGLVQRARLLGQHIVPTLEAVAADNPILGQVRGRGAMIGIEFVKPDSGAPNPEFTSAVVSRCHEEGVIVLAAGTYGNVIRLLPPLVIGEDLLAEGLSVLVGAIEAATRESSPAELAGV